jgi:type VI secretion system protein VasG
MLIRFIEKNILPEIGGAVLNMAGETFSKNKNAAMHVVLSQNKDIDIIRNTEEMATE